MSKWSKKSAKLHIKIRFYNRERYITEKKYRQEPYFYTITHTPYA